MCISKVNNVVLIQYANSEIHFLPVNLHTVKLTILRLDIYEITSNLYMKSNRYNVRINKEHVKRQLQVHDPALPSNTTYSLKNVQSRTELMIVQKPIIRTVHKTQLFIHGRYPQVRYTWTNYHFTMQNI